MTVTRYRDEIILHCDECKKETFDEDHTHLDLDRVVRDACNWGWSDDHGFHRCPKCTEKRACTGSQSGS